MLSGARPQCQPPGAAALTPVQADELTCTEGDTFATSSAGGLWDSVGRTSVMISEWFVDPEILRDGRRSKACSTVI